MPKVKRGPSSPGSSAGSRALVVGGLSALGAGLFSMGIPKDSVVKYETALKSDKFLLLAHRTMAEVSKAKEILLPTGAVDSNVHAA